MFGKRESFEVLACREGRWTIETTATSQTDAEAFARKVLNKQGVSGVKVVREVARGDTARETVVFEQTRELRDSGKIFVNDVDEAPYCESVEEVFAGRGRQTINRLFRAYLDKNGVTATEVMHDFRELRRIVDADTLIASGVGKVATLQAKGRDDTDTGKRRDTLYGFLDEITARARAAAEKKLPAIRTDGFDGAVGKIVASADPGQCDYLLRVVVARELVQQRSFFGKLAQTMDWAEPADDDRARALVDTYISDILANAETLQDLLGLQPSLGAALGSLIDLAQGRLEADSEGQPADSPEALAGRLNALLGLEALPDSQAMLVDRVRRQLEAKSPLARGEPDEEAEAFRALIDKLMPGDDLFGGGSIAEALTHRQSRILNKGGIAGLKEATGRLLPSFSDPARKAAYLLALSESRLVESIGDEISMQLEGLFIRPESVKQIVKDNRPPNKKMETITTVVKKVQGSGLADGFKTRIANHLDDLLASYIVDDRILERVDDPSRPLHIRAFMLLSMCTPEMLPEGKASQLARKIVVKHLKRPNFETELVAEVPPAEQERVLRDFHVQLYRCGFMQ
ncbi:hypothetical protein GCM10017083_41280 [Thalassobaculum fulvum]|uniref:Uncharacterized protein n=1 Tax=Thalassobaculum fulvum TaxID=1633335 RepID=A0A919CSL2_9PROT|nr:hypothetical protein [Thalassobaculum fulvum]GHD58388.1 hypothetical protein GCM10017083_41280 [Thalassobaculum fulvum]